MTFEFDNKNITQNSVEQKKLSEAIFIVMFVKSINCILSETQ